MTLGELPNSSYFAVIASEEESQLLIKGSDGKIYTAREFLLLDSPMAPETNVQAIFLKAPGC